MRRRLRLLMLLSNGTRLSVPATLLPPADKPYDHRGALWYVATVVTVYAMAILFMIVSHINRRSVKRELDREVSLFLRSAPTVRVEEERQRRRNLKRAMQPFIRLALDRRTVGVCVSAVGDDAGGDLVTHPSIETLASVSRAPERLPVGDRVLKSSRRWRSRSSHSLLRLPGILQRQRTASVAESGGGSWRSGSDEDVTVPGAGYNDINDKAIQCGLDPRQCLANRARTRLTSVPSEAELGASASSQKLAMLLQKQRQQRESAAAAVAGPSAWQNRQLRLELVASNGDRGVRGAMSASSTHVPRFLSSGSVPSGARKWLQHKAVSDPRNSGCPI